MNFLNPLAFLLATLLPIIVLMYLLRLRRPTQMVSSTYLWQRLVRDVEANAPWQKLKYNILMVLQLLFLSAVIIALTNPFLWTEGTGSSSMLIIIDTSASMSAIDVKPSRIEAAKQQAQSLVESSPENTRTTVISAGENTEILVSASQDRKLTQQAINLITSATGHSDLSSALQIAAAITSRQPDTDVVILSDGKVDLPERVAIRGNIIYYPIGLGDENQGITNIQLQQNTGGENSTIFIQIENFSSLTASRRLEIFIDNALFDATDLDIKPFSQTNYIRESLPGQIHAIEAKLGSGDFYTKDDTAWAVGGNIEAAEVILITEGNRFLETALSILPNISLSSLTPDRYQEATNLDADLMIFDSFVPVEEQISSASIIFISPPQSTAYFDVVGVIEQPKPRPVIDDQLLKNISFDGVNILKAINVALPAWANISLSGDYNNQSMPLIFYGSKNGQRIAVISFQFQNSDLPIQVGFPILISNLVNWLVPYQSVQPTGTNRETSSLAVSVPLDTISTTITYPDGRTVQKAPNQPGVLAIDTPQAGIYTIGWDEEDQILVAVNQFSGQESDIAPAMELEISRVGETIISNNQYQSRNLIWRVFAYIALILLVTEWLIYNRGSLSKLSNLVLKRENK